MKKRVKETAAILMIVAALLCVRVLYIQIICEESLSDTARGQYFIRISGADNKRVIYDRNMNRITDSNRAYYYLIEKEKMSEKLMKLIRNIGGEDAGYKGTGYILYKSYVFDEDVNRILRDEFEAYCFSCYGRYSKDQTGEALIRNIENMYSENILYDSCRTGITGNGAGTPIGGFGIDYSNCHVFSERAIIATTINLEMQKSIEKIFSDRFIKGAAVVSDVKNGEILAMVSSEKDENTAICKEFRDDELFEIIKDIVYIETGKSDEISITNTASELGFGRLVTGGIPSEAFGNLSNRKEQFRSTVIQVNKMTAIIGNRGFDEGFKIIKGKEKYEEPKSRAVSENTVAAGMELFDETKNKSEGFVTGIVTGEKTKYAVTIISENGKPDENQKLSLFSEIAKLIV